MPTKKVAKKVTKKVVKKAVKKVATKTAKKTTKTVSRAAKSENFKALVCASDAECFWTRDGRVLQSLDHLKLAIATMDDEVFLHHVTEEKNDFADWVQIVLQDEKCAADLRKAQEIAAAKKALDKHLKQYGL